jgi:hypothetical protein
MFKSPDSIQESSEPTLSQKEIFETLCFHIQQGGNIKELIKPATEETLEKIKRNQTQIKSAIIYRLREGHRAGEGYGVEDYVPLATEQTLNSIKEDVDLRHIPVAEIFNKALHANRLTSIEKRPGLKHIID